MSLGSMRTLLLFMIFIMKYIFKFLPEAEQQPDNEETTLPEPRPDSRYLPLF